MTASDDLKSFADRDKIQDYAYKAVKWAVANKIIEGAPNNNKTYINPASAAKRCQMAAIFCRFVKNA
jgi:hypothetical protein